MKKHILIIWIIFTLLVVISTTSYADDGIINGCYKKNNGQLRVVENLDDCSESEIPIFWNQEGPPGEQGEQGPAGVLGYEVVTDATDEDDTDLKFLNVECPPDKVAIGGGARVFGRIDDGIAIVANGPEGDPSAPQSWSGLAQEINPAQDIWGLRVDVFCVNAP